MFEIFLNTGALINKVLIAWIMLRVEDESYEIINTTYTLRLLKWKYI